ncbi:organic hydroperoxide reductase OsmC/OhrA [Naumannella cuiyingiana]|uniref:Organic hydroperoxide reductase OsmC/OhrA n=1 Tax=Naumannella cuiyingiana TaxID=1347891 RepID=A0A7Z0IL97_9ACTN|nr:organic hydroperoxide reductase OsmC/OhrA [Naumannella cuiyingiana]
MRHSYDVEVEWTGNRGAGTTGHRDYGREHIVRVDGLPDIAGTADPAFRGDRERHNPEQLLVAALAQCHMLSYFHRAVLTGVVVTAYADRAHGEMTQEGSGGCFERVVLHPVVTVADASMVDAAIAAHGPASADCFIANSVNFPVDHEVTILVEGQDG